MLPKIHNYIPPQPLLWQGRKDSLPLERFFQHVDCIDVSKTSLPSKKNLILLGFGSDEGIRRNLGRLGAKLGPDALREQLAKLACHSNQSFIDIGDVVCNHGNLEQAQEQFASLINYCHEHGHKTIAFGGGHEIAWAHFQGLAPSYPKIGIINFDAHFDLRPADNNQSTSGTPFWQINQFCKINQRSFDYCCLGIQPLANTTSLFDNASDSNVRYLTTEQMHNQGNASQIAFLDEFMLSHDCLYLTICLDVFAECFAPGVSAPQAMGLSPWQVLPLLKHIIQSGKVVSLDVAELSPALDHQQKTARLAATLIGYILNLNQI